MTADTVGGVWTYALELAQELVKNGDQVHLATMGAVLLPSQRAEVEAMEGVHLHPSSYRLEWMPDPWEDVARAGLWLLELEKELQPDLVHLNGYVHGALPWQAPVVVVGHSCVLSWWQAVKGTRAPAEWDRYAQKVREGLQAAAYVSAPTEAMRQSLEKYYGPLPSSSVVYNGRSEMQFLPGTKEPILLSAGRLWDDAKNIQTLAQAAKGLPWKVYTAGDSHRPEGGEASFPNVHLLGVLPPHELAQWLGKASIYALPARYEPFGLSALEAALAGCALVLGDIPSLREVWGDAALFVDPNDTDAWQETLADLISDETRIQEMAARAHEHALLYTPSRMAQGCTQIYHQLVPAKEQNSCV